MTGKPRPGSPFAAMIGQGREEVERPGEPPRTEEAQATPAPPKPAAEPPRREGREPYSTRLRPSVKRTLDRFVFEMKHDGWPVNQYDVIEALIAKLGDADFAAELRQSLGKSEG